MKGEALILKQRAEGGYKKGIGSTENPPSRAQRVVQNIKLIKGAVLVRRTPRTALLRPCHVHVCAAFVHSCDVYALLAGMNFRRVNTLT